VNAPEVEFVDNDEFEGTGELLSLSKALNYLEGEVILSFGDILFRKHILNNLVAEEHDIVIAVDAAWERRQNAGGYIDYVTATRPYALRYDEEEVFLTATGPHLDRANIHGEWIGLIKMTSRGSAQVKAAISDMARRADFRTLRFDDLFKYLLEQKQRVQVLYITGHWLDVDDLNDLSRAQTF
jgi:phosphoenolpyruvate phosphomutase